jgi:cell division protein FtsZ
LGPHLTQGLGAGANPNIGRQATEESLEEIKRILEVNTKMAFITAGMGGGPGTGGAPIIAKICKELGILTVGIVTTPFAYEGKKRIAQAQEGIDFLKENVDTLLVISNDKLRNQFGNLKMKEAFGKADNVLATAAKCITDVINTTGQINVDFADVCTVMSNGGVAILGSAMASGENRAQLAIENALTSPLLNDSDIRGAKWILININSSGGDYEYTMDEVEVIQNYIISQAGDETDVILGLGYDDTLGDNIGITLIATGFERKDPFSNNEAKNKVTSEEKVVLQLDLPKQAPVAVPVTTELVANDSLTVAQQETEKVELSIALDLETQKDLDPMMPTLKENLMEEKVSEEKKNIEISEEPIFFEISSSVDQIPTTKFPIADLQLTELPIQQVDPAPKNQIAEKEASSDNFLSSGGYLAKPTQIYVEEMPESPTSQLSEEPLSISTPAKEDEPLIEMELVVKESQNATEESKMQQTQPIMNSNVEEPAVQDETEELRRRAMDRIAKLRSLSFNVSATDPNSEFETVPAYLRRNMEMQVQIADVETFYSNYTVKSKDNNQAEINTINTFLDGKKPD